MTAAPPPAEPLRPTARAPEPGCLWIRYAPRGWPAPRRWWLDLAKGELVAPAVEERVGEGRPPSALPELAGGPFDDVVWLPPVPAGLRGERDRLAERLATAGTPVLVQALPGERVRAAAATVVVDLTEALLKAAGLAGGAGRDGQLLDEGSREGPGGAATAHSAVAERKAGEAGAGPAAHGSVAAGEGATGLIEAGAGVPPGGNDGLATRAASPPAAGAGVRDPRSIGTPDEAAASGAPRRGREEQLAAPLVDLFAGASAGGELAGLASAAAVWPLIAGLTDRPDLVAAGLDALAAAGAAAVQPVVPRLAPADRRRLAESAGDEAFDLLFHGGEPDERAFARAAAARGLGFLLPRPLPRPPLAGAANRRIAADLGVAGELWLRLGRTPSQAQAFFRAARWADETGYDLPALAREGNLGVVAAVDDASRALIEEAAASAGEPSLVGVLRAAYVAEEGA